MTKNAEKHDDKGTEKKINDAHERAQRLFNQDRFTKALKTNEEMISDHGEKKFCSAHHHMQGDIFFELAKRTDIDDFKRLYLFASLDGCSTSSLLRPDSVSSLYGCVRSLVELGNLLGVNKYYVEAVSKAKYGLSIRKPSQDVLAGKLESLIKTAEEKMKPGLQVVTVSDTGTMANQMESGKQDPDIDRFKKLWADLDEETKKDFLVVDSQSLIQYIDDQYDNEVKENIQKCLLVHDKLSWRWWKCQVCHQVNFCFTDCKWHIIENHVEQFQPQISALPKCVDKVLADMIRCGDWEPLDAAAAAKLIMSRIESESELMFVYVKGWCSAWPVSDDEGRKQKLKQLAQVLKSCCPSENNTLSCSLWKWLIDYTEENVSLPNVLGIYIDECGLFKSPQCLCLLDIQSLDHILDYLRHLTTDVRTSVFSTAVNQFWKNSLVKERVYFEQGTGNLLLDERLLNGTVLHHFDDIGKVGTFHSSGIYEKVKPQGDNIISWVFDSPKIDDKVVSQVAESLHHVGIWFAALRVVRCSVRELVSNSNEREKLTTYDRMLSEVEALCDIEDKRKFVDKRSRYAWMLRMECAKRVKQEYASKICFLNVVRDVLRQEESPKFEDLENKEYMDRISKLSSVENDAVKETLVKLRNSVNDKYHLIDSKVLLSECMRKELVDVFPKLSAIEHRLVLLPVVKMFLQDKLKRMMKTHKRKREVAAGDGEPNPKKGFR